MFSSLKFFIGGYGGPSYSLKLKIQSGELQEKAILYDAEFYRHQGAEKIILPNPQISLPDWLTQWDTLNVARWKPKYQAEAVVDGTNWSLEYTENGIQHRSNGSNRHPRGWRKFIQWIQQRYPEIS